MDGTQLNDLKPVTVFEGTKCLPELGIEPKTAGSRLGTAPGLVHYLRHGFTL